MNAAATIPPRCALFVLYSARSMELSREFSINTSILLNGVAFADLDAAEKRLLLAGYQAGLLASMPQEARAAVEYLENHAGAIRRERVAAK